MDIRTVHNIEVLMDRLTPTFDLAAETLILGFREKLKQGVEER